MIQRIKDWLHERRIRRHCRSADVYSVDGWNELRRLIGKRSPQQVARMEREKGLA